MIKTKDEDKDLYLRYLIHKKEKLEEKMKKLERESAELKEQEEKIKIQK